MEETPTPRKSMPAFLGNAMPKDPRFIPPTLEELQAQYSQGVEDRKMLRERSIPFITPAFHPDFALCQGLILVGAVTGHGKTTTNANILAGFIENSPEHTQALVISNEEVLTGVYDRVACVLLGKDYNDYRRGKFNNENALEIEAKAYSLMPRIVVVQGNNNRDRDMCCLEDVKAVLEHATDKANQYALITIDYLQTISYSRANPLLDKYKVSKSFGDYLKDYGKRNGAPVVLFCQLKTRSQEPREFKDRVEGDSTMTNHAFDAIECIPDIKNRKTVFVFHKSRFGIAKETEVVMDYHYGQYRIGSEI